MGIPELMKTTSIEAGVSRLVCERTIDAFIEVIKQALVDDGKVSIPGFMILEVVDSPEQRRRDPSTGEVCLYPPSKRIRCTLSKKFKKSVKDKQENDNGSENYKL